MRGEARVDPVLVPVRCLTSANRRSSVARTVDSDVIDLYTLLQMSQIRPPPLILIWAIHCCHKQKRERQERERQERDRQQRELQKRREQQPERAAAAKKERAAKERADFSSKFGKQERENPEDLRIRLQGGQVNLFYCILLSHELHILVNDS